MSAARSKWCSWAGALALACALEAHAGLFDDTQARAQITTLKSQVDDANKRLDSMTQNQVDLANQIESLKSDIAKLHGQIDELTYNLDAAQKRQKDFYLDLDNRLRKIEAQGAAPQVDAAPKSEPVVDPMRDYEAALAALKNSDFKSAAAGFESFIAKATPDSPQLPSAHFFAGYCYSNLKQPAKAAELYRRLTENWPSDEHAPDAMLARSENLSTLGQPKEAHQVLVSLVAKYPASDAAKQAKARLKKK